MFALITNSIYLDLKKVFVSISGKYLSKLKNISRDYFRLCAQQVGREQPFLRRFRDSELPPLLLISCSLSQYTGCPKKTHFQNAAGATVQWLNHHLPAPLVPGDLFFARFLLRLSRIKRPQVNVHGKI